jgi:hypothetical protein
MYLQISGAMICCQQRIKAEMTMASMHVPTLHKARAGGHLRARSLKTFNTLGRKDGRVNRGGAGGRSRQSRQRKPAGQNWSIRRARWPSHLAVSHFLFPKTLAVKILELTDA